MMKSEMRVCQFPVPRRLSDIEADQDSRIWRITQAQDAGTEWARRAWRVAAFSKPTAFHQPGKPNVSV